MYQRRIIKFLRKHKSEDIDIITLKRGVPHRYDEKFVKDLLLLVEDDIVDSRGGVFCLTSPGKHAARQRDQLRFWFPVFLSIVAIIVSVIALCK